MLDDTHLISNIVSLFETYNIRTWHLQTINMQLWRTKQQYSKTHA